MSHYERKYREVAFSEVMVVVAAGRQPVSYCANEGFWTAKRGAKADGVKKRQRQEQPQIPFGNDEWRGKATTGVLRFAQDDGVEQATAKARAKADSLRE